MKFTELLSTPQTQSDLYYADGKLISADNSGITYLVKDGVTFFSSFSIESDQKEDQLNTMIEAAKLTDCITAIRQSSISTEYLLNEERRKYLDLVNIQPSDVVLEIGASLGQHTRIIAQQCKHLEALEVVPQQATFNRLWCNESNLTNVNVSCGGNDGYLPYKTNSFDVLIINYVLEWCAGRSNTSPEDFHLQLLKECNRVIKPGGKIFISTKNRFNIRLLMGGIDEHVDFRFGNALPRKLMNYLSNKNEICKATSCEALGYLHSKNKFEQLMKNAGFSELQPFLLLPDAREPTVVETFDIAGLNRIKEQNYWKKSSKKELIFSLLPYIIQRNIAPSHVYIAKKHTDK